MAVKTGTSRHFTDNWAVGTTRRFTVAVWAGNFDGRPMEGVSGITGAGPLLHRAVTIVAQSLPPGSLATPGELGAARLPVCRLSGLRAAGRCARLDEWFAPGTAPTRDDDWERDGRVTLPDEYADWAQGGLRPASDPVLAAEDASPGEPTATAAGSRLLAMVAAEDSVRAAHDARFRIVSPLDGDRYAIPVGVEARYATIPLRAAGPGADGVRWSVDGAPFDGERWRLAPGTHRVRARSTRGETAEARIVVEAQ